MKTQNCFQMLIAMLILICISCDDDKETSIYSFPLAKQNNINESVLIKAYEKIDDISQIQSLLVSRNGVLVSEVYFHDYTQNELHDVMSVTKSFTSTLIGIAIDKGFIQSVDQTLGDFITPDIYPLDAQKSAISIRNLLRMSSGIPWKEIGAESEYVTWVNSPNQVIYILDKSMTYTPGTLFNYSDGNAHLVSVVLTKATGMSSFEFAKEYLFKPLEMEYYAWYVDKQGFYYGGTTMDLTPSGMLRFGQMFLDNGVYKGIQIVSSSWVEQATTNHIQPDNSIYYQNGYGYFWWLGVKNEHNFYYANGYGGQFIVVIPDLETVIVATNNWMNVPRTECGTNWYQTISTLVDEVIPAIN
jgi:CubicO group peptidase (beta-lactamase class C family)